MPLQVGNVLVWGRDVDETTVAQAQKAASLPILAGHLALMPDAHIGIGSTIGSVIPTSRAVIPACVGVDIGCGVAAAPTNLEAADLPADLRPLHALIAAAVPAGVGQGHASPQSLGMARYGLEIPDRFDQRQRATVLNQFGTLGSGNHFVEICVDEVDAVWILLHSGSRGIGNQLATKHVKVARELFARPGYCSFVLPDADLAWLDEGSPQFDAYLEDMLYSQRYAYGNRARMLENITGALANFIAPLRWGFRLEVGDVINNHHNYTQLETHNGAELWLTRKGAIPAGAGMLGIIPGSMGTRSYIVEGLGNPASYCSCSHGAGRRMSRGMARRTLTTESLNAYMAGRAWNSRDATALLDEHPEAYKDVDRVMEDQSDLVRIRHTLRAVLNYKGVK